MEEIGTISVPIERLDTVLSPADIIGPALLKIDVQGFEYEVLGGITNLISQIRWIYVEASYIELYQGQKLYPDVLNLLTDLGYRQVSRSNVERDEDGHDIQADILFERIH